MRKKVLMSCRLVGALLIGCGLAFAHHGTSVSYDQLKTITVTGTVTEFLWRNPHGQLWVDVKDEKGNLVKWGFELHSILLMTRAGWTKDFVKPGDQVMVTAHPSRAGTPLGVLVTIKLPDNKEYFRDIPQQ